MANESLYTSFSDTRIAAALSAEYGRLIAERSSLPSHPALRYAGAINGTGSTAITLPLLGVDGYDLPASETDGDATAATVISDDKITVTVAPYRKVYRPTDLARLTDPNGKLDPLRWAQDAFISNMTKAVDIVAALAGTYTASVGVSGSDLTFETILEAQTTLEVAKNAGRFLCVLHPRQFADLRADLATNSGGAVQWTPATQELIQVLGQGYVGSWGNIDFFVSTYVDTANGGADYAGGLIATDGVVWADGRPTIDMPDLQIAIPHGMFEIDRDSEHGVTQLVSHFYFGASKGQEAAGVKIVSDA